MYELLFLPKEPLNFVYCCRLFKGLVLGMDYSETYYLAWIFQGYSIRHGLFRDIVVGTENSGTCY